MSKIARGATTRLALNAFSKSYTLTSAYSKLSALSVSHPSDCNPLVGQMRLLRLPGVYNDSERAAGTEQTVGDLHCAAEPVDLFHEFMD